MSVNLIKSFKQIVGDQLISRISGFLGEPVDRTTGAMDTLLPSLMAGMIEKSRSKEGAADMLEFINKEGINGNLLSNMSTLFTGGEATEGLIAQGEKVVDFLFDKKSGIQASIVGEVTKTGFHRGSANSLLRLVSPILTGVLSRQINENDLDGQAFQALLIDQKPHLLDLHSREFYKNLGFVTLFTEESKTSTPQSEESTESAQVEKKSSVLSKIGPWLILGTLALGMLTAMRSCGGRPDGISSMIEESEKLQDSLARARDSVDSTGASSRLLLQPDSIAIQRNFSPHGGFIELVHSHLYGAYGDDSTRYTFDQLTFRDNSDEITAPSIRQLDHLASLMIAYPMVRISIQAYVAASGRSNFDLAGRRADAVTRSLIELGVDSTRMEAHGDIDPESHPVIDSVDHVDLFIINR